MKNLLLLFSTLIFLFSCKKDKEESFVYEPVLIHTELIEMDTFTSNVYTSNVFVLNINELSSASLAASKFNSYSFFDVSSVKLVRVSIEALINSYGDRSEIDSLKFSVNDNRVFNLANNYMGGYGTLSYGESDFQFTDIFDRPTNGGPEHSFNLELLPKESNNTATSTFKLIFEFQPKIQGVYIKD